MGLCFKVDAEIERNGSVHHRECFELSYLILGTAVMLLAFVTVVGNCVVIVIAFMNKKLHNSFFCMIINLAIADLCVGLFDMPLFVVEMFIGHWPKWKVLCNFIVFCDYVPPLGSLYSKVAIAMNRYHSLNATATQRQLCSRYQRNVVGVVSVWSLAVALWFSTTSQPKAVEIFGQSRCMEDPVDNVKYAIFISVVAHYVPSLMVIYFNSIILVYVRMLIAKRASTSTNSHTVTSKESDVSQASHGTANSRESNGSMIRRVSRSVRRSLGLENILVPEALWLAPITLLFTASPGDRDGAPKTRERKVAQALLSVLVVHVAISVPSNIMYSVHIWSRADHPYHILRFLFYANSAANPFLYAFSSEDFQRVYRETMGWAQDPRLVGPGKRKDNGRREMERRQPPDCYRPYNHQMPKPVPRNDMDFNWKKRTASEHSVDPIRYIDLHNQLREQLLDRHIQIAASPHPTPIEAMEQVPCTPENA